MSISNTPPSDNQDYQVQDSLSAVPTYPISNFEEDKVQEFYQYISDRVNVMPEADELIERSLSSAIGDLHNAYAAQARQEVIMSSDVAQDTQRDVVNDVIERENQLITGALRVISDSIVTYLSSESLVRGTDGSERYVVNNSNSLQIASIILGMGVTVSDTGFTDLIDRINDQRIESPADEQFIFNYIVAAGPNSLINSSNVFTEHILNQGLTSIPDSAIDSIKVHLLMRVIDTQRIFEFAMTQLASNPDAASLVILELVKMPPPKGIPTLQANARIATIALDQPDGQRGAFESLITQINSLNPIQMQAEYAAAAERLSNATVIPTDITNAGLDWSRISSFVGFYYLGVVGALSASVSLITHNRTAAVAALVTPAIGMIAAANGTAGQELLGTVTDPTRELHYNEANNRILVQREARQRLSFTLRGSQNLANFFSSTRVIQLIQMNSNPEEGQNFNLENFERLLSPELRQIYFAEFASNFSTNRPQLVTAMGQVAADYQTLEVTDHATFAENLARPSNVDPELLTDLSNGQ
jgi:hypothetical protein